MNVKIRIRALSVLMALLLMTVMMVPVVSATEVKDTNLEVKNSIYEILELQEPDITKNLQWQSYCQASEAVDELISLSNIKIEKDRIIGFIEGENEKALLYRTNDDDYNIILENDGIISIEKAEVKDLGSKVISSQGKNDLPETTTEYVLKEISLSNTKSNEFGSKSVYSETITRTDSWIYLGYTRATLYTKGTFTYDYGNQILGISDSSYTYQGIGFDRCDFDHSTRTVGITGYVEADVIWAYMQISPPKHSVDAWISCNYYGATDGDSNYSNWVGIGGFGCMSLP